MVSMKSKVGREKVMWRLFDADCRVLAAEVKVRS